MAVQWINAGQQLQCSGGDSPEKVRLIFLEPNNSREIGHDTPLRRGFALDAIFRAQKQLPKHLELTLLA
jgi:hypothetical protein